MILQKTGKDMEIANTIKKIKRIFMIHDAHNKNFQLFQLNL